MDRFDEIVAVLKDIRNTDKAKKPNFFVIIGVVVLVVVAIAAVVYAIYKFTRPKFEDDFAFDSEDDFDDFFEDEEDDVMPFEEADIETETLFEDEETEK